MIDCDIIHIFIDLWLNLPLSKFSPVQKRVFIWTEDEESDQQGHWVCERGTWTRRRFRAKGMGSNTMGLENFKHSLLVLIYIIQS